MRSASCNAKDFASSWAGHLLSAFNSMGTWMAFRRPRIAASPSSQPVMRRMASLQASLRVFFASPPASIAACRSPS